MMLAKTIKKLEGRRRDCRGKECIKSALQSHRLRDLVVFEGKSRVEADYDRRSAA